MKYRLYKRCENCFEKTVYETPWGEFCGSCGFGSENLEYTIDDAWELRERKFVDSKEKRICIWCHRGWALPTGKTLENDKNQLGYWFKHENCSDFIAYWEDIQSSEQTPKEVKI